ncbi:MAG: hypothetical protein ACPG5B_06630 [Chitinophagales bacterium]
MAIQVLKKEIEIFRARRNHSVKGLNLTRKWVQQNEQFISWIEPIAGALCCIKLKEEKFNNIKVEKFYTVSKKAGIQIANGKWFGESKRFFRLGFGYMSIKKLIVTLDKLTEIIKKTAAK